MVASVVVVITVFTASILLVVARFENEGDRKARYANRRVK
jgi:hypothetical protein